MEGASPWQYRTPPRISATRIATRPHRNRRRSTEPAGGFREIAEAPAGERWRLEARSTSTPAISLARNTGHREGLAEQVNSTRSAHSRVGPDTAGVRQIGDVGGTRQLRQKRALRARSTTTQFPNFRLRAERFQSGSRSKRAASRLRYAAGASVRPLTSAACSADSASADGLRLDEIGEAAGATLEERCNAHGSPRRAPPDARERSTGASVV